MTIYFKNSIALSFSLAKAGFKVRNEGSYLGILWYLLSPLSFFLIILYLRGTLSLDAGVAYYPAYLLIGLIMMNMFNQSVATSIDIIRSNANFIKSIKIPYEVFVVSTVFKAIFSHVFELILVALLFLYLHISLVGIIFYLFVFIFFVLFILGVCFLFATVGLYFNDFKNVWTIAAQLLLFATPVFYAVTPGSHLYLANLFNPLFYFLTSARAVAIYHVLPSGQMMAAVIVGSLIVFFAGLFIFNRSKGRFAEFV
jgi:ABC-type polysaccharide/polyol phosphate export permease